MATFTFRTSIAKAHAKVIASAPAADRAGLCHIAADCLVNRHEDIGDVAAYLDAEIFYEHAVAGNLTVEQIDAYLNAVEASI